MSRRALLRRNSERGEITKTLTNGDFPKNSDHRDHHEGPLVKMITLSHIRIDDTGTKSIND